MEDEQLNHDQQDEEGTFTLNEEQILSMTSYLSECHKTTIINDDQYQTYLNQLWNQDSNFENNMKDLNLWEGFSQYQLEQNKTQKENQQLFEQQQSNLRQTIKDSQMKIKQIQDQIPLLKNQLDSIMPEFENAKRRYEQFPENPNLQSVFQTNQTKHDELQSQLLNNQNQIEQLQSEIELWTQELIS